MRVAKRLLSVFSAPYRAILSTTRYLLMENTTTSTTIQCKHCSAEVSASSAFCSSCGQPLAAPKKFCKHCGASIAADAVICTVCGRQVEELRQAASPQAYQSAPAPSIVINNDNNNVNSNVNRNTATAVAGGTSYGYRGKPKSKIVALVLCALLGIVGAHKFYEGKYLMGIVYAFTCGLFLFGVAMDFIALLAKPDPYYVK